MDAHIVPTSPYAGNMAPQAKAFVSFVGGTLPGLVLNKPATIHGNLNAFDRPSTAGTSRWADADGHHFETFPSHVEDPSTSRIWATAVAPAYSLENRHRSPGNTVPNSPFGWNVPSGRQSAMSGCDPVQPTPGNFGDKSISTFSEFPKITTWQQGEVFNMEIEEQFKMALKLSRRSPPEDYICQCCYGEIDNGKHWITECPKRNPNPPTPYQGDRRSCGEFICKCRNKFYSANTYANTMKRCNKCGRMVPPAKMWAHPKVFNAPQFRGFH